MKNRNSKRGRRLGVLLILGLALMLGHSPTAAASMILTLDDPAVGIGVPDVIIQDGTAAGVPVLSLGGLLTTHADGALDGFITFTGGVGVWGINVTTGISKPVLGGPLVAQMDLNNVSVTSAGGAGTMVLSLTDTDFLLPPIAASTVLTNKIGGTTQGTVTADGYLDPANAEFGIAPIPPVVNISQGPFGGAYSDASSVVISPAVVGAFSLTEIVTIVHTAAGQVSSFDKEITALVPEPASMLLMGSGLLSLAAFYRRKTKRKG